MATSVARKTAAKSANSASPRAARKTPARSAAPAKAPAAKAPAAKAPAAKPISDPAKVALPPAAAPKPQAEAGKGRQPNKKVTLVRDSFTFPKLEYGVIGVLKTRATHLGRPTKKSEIVRAGIKALLGMSDADFMACVSSLPAAKPDRGSKA